MLTAAAPAPAPIGIGINYIWWRLTPVSLAQCRADGEPLASGNFFLPFYQDPVVRAEVRRQLAAMHASGFTTLRVLVFYYHTTDASSADSFVGTNGNLRVPDRAKLRDFVTDVAEAKFARLEVVPSFQAENWIYCRKHDWGDCFEPSRTDENWRFIRETARIAIGAARDMDVRLDLANEGAPDPTMNAKTLKRASAYLQAVAGRFQTEFGSAWTISTARSQASAAGETSNRLELLVQDLGAAGLVPRYLELHTYSADGNDVTESLDELNAIATRIGAKEILGELSYHASVQAGAIAGWLRRHASAPVVDLIQWPEYDPYLACAPMPQPPYSPGPYSTIHERVAGR